MHYDVHGNRDDITTFVIGLNEYSNLYLHAIGGVVHLSWVFGTEHALKFSSRAKAEGLLPVLEGYAEGPYQGNLFIDTYPETSRR